MTEHTINYTHDPFKKEIFAKNEAGKVVAEINYSGNEQIWTITHTGVRPEYRGGDIAQTLVRLVVEAAREAGVRLNATCSYAVKVLDRIVEYHDVYSPLDSTKSL
jgi:predicted GNAT family acetyltransferase